METSFDRFKEQKEAERTDEGNMYVSAGEVIGPDVDPFASMRARVYINGQMVGGQAMDPSLSRDYHDRWRGNTVANMARMQSAIYGTNGLLAKQPEEIQLEKMEVLRMYPSKIGVGVDIYVRFVLNEKEYWGAFNRWGDYSNSTFYCEALNVLDTDKNRKAKILGMIRNELVKWLTPAPGMYKTLAESVLTYDESGTPYNIKKGTEVTVVTSDAGKTPYVLFRVNERVCKLSGNNFFFFNYWFDRVMLSPTPVLE